MLKCGFASNVWNVSNVQNKYPLCKITHTSKELRFIVQHSSQMSKVGLVANNLYDDLWVSVVT